MNDDVDRETDEGFDDNETSTDVFTGSPVDARFDVEMQGELDLASVPDADTAPTGLDTASYSVDPQLGETLPPELRSPQAGEARSSGNTSGGDAASRDESANDARADHVSQQVRADDADLDDGARGGEDAGAFGGLEEFELPDATDPGFTRADLDEADAVQPGAETAAGADPAEAADRAAGGDDEREPPPAPSADVVELPRGQMSADDERFDLLEDGDDADRKVDWESFTGEQYVGSSTQEYEGLAAELEAARFEDHEQSAIAAAIPGLDSGVVGLEDVTGEVAPEVGEAPRTLTDLGLRIATGLGLLALFFLSLITPVALGVLATAVFAFAAFEFYAALLRTGHHPVPLFGLAGVLGCLVGAWVWGVVAIPIAVVATIIAVALFYGTSSPRTHTLRDASLTILGAVWIGGFGSFAMPIIESDGYGWLIGGVVVLVVAMDVGQYFSGRTFGRRPLAPVISPKKTVEGLVGGAVITLLFGFLLSYLGPFTRMSALLLAGVAIVAGPLGDLAVSSIKRRVGVKDMGTLLPGHGGILDRIDALLFVVPGAWVVLLATGLIS